MKYAFLPSQSSRTVIIQTDRPARNYLEQIAGVVTIDTIGANIYALDLAPDASPSAVVRNLALALNGVHD